MPYKKSYSRKRRHTRKMTLSKKVHRALKQMKPETKYIGDAVDNSVVGAWAVADAIPPITQGVTDSARVGGKVYLKRVMYNCALRHNAASANNFATMRFVLGRYQGSALPLPEEIIVSDDSVLNHWQVNKAGQYQILTDRLIHVGLAGPDRQIQYFKVNIPLNRTMIFDANGDTRGNTFRYFMLISSDQAANGPELSYDRRLVYSDP